MRETGNVILWRQVICTRLCQLTLRPAAAPQDESLGSVATVVLRGSTEGFLDDVERAVDDGVNAYKVRATKCSTACMRLMSLQQSEQRPRSYVVSVCSRVEKLAALNS